MANKRMVLTLPARGNFGIIARYTGLGGVVSILLPVKARVGRTCEALAIFLAASALLLLLCCSALLLGNHCAVMSAKEWRWRKDLRMAMFLFLGFLVSTGCGFMLALPRTLKTESRKVFVLAAVKAVLGIVVPVFTFMLGALLVPGWTGECIYGWIDCFHVGKFALGPIVAWAIAAFYATEVWSVRDCTQHWIVFGFLLGAAVSIISLFHGAATVIVTFGFPLSWGLVIPFYVSVWYTGRTIHLLKASNIRVTEYLWALLGSLPFWLLSIVLSKRMYVDLPEKPPACFVVSASLQGHPAIVGPFVTISHRGQERQVNTQLLTFWQFEAIWSLMSPMTHQCFRKAYNMVGPLIASCIRTPWVADVAYILLKPFEMLAKSLLWLAKRKGKASHCYSRK